ncbi:hypothetical protein NDU88_007167 [Pleurodeles waltl]|uniref:Uncharacterized protein n=1 Tax=Pleurodeles waltl TaxID=8319 RepID=A0AAV7NSW3_PLEWA|nr:hypothetical protein NDU88_007167 [Pleurodeles waltl]
MRTRPAGGLRRADCDSDIVNLLSGTPFGLEPVMPACCVCFRHGSRAGARGALALSRASLSLARGPRREPPTAG